MPVRKPELIVLDRNNLKMDLNRVIHRYLADCIIKGDSPNAVSLTNVLWNQLFVDATAATDQPRAEDILCDRDPKANKSAGTTFARSIVSKYVEAYDRLHHENSRRQKGEMMGNIVEEIKYGDKHMLSDTNFEMPRVFFKRMWVPMFEDEARKRVGHWLRDHPNSSRDTKKVRKRLEKKTNQADQPMFTGHNDQADEDNDDETSSSHFSGSAMSRDPYGLSLPSKGDSVRRSKNPLPKQSISDGIALVASAAAMLETPKAKRGDSFEWILPQNSLQINQRKDDPARSVVYTPSVTRDGGATKQDPISGKSRRQQQQRSGSMKSLSNLPGTTSKKRIDVVVEEAIRKRAAKEMAKAAFSSSLSSESRKRPYKDASSPKLLPNEKISDVPTRGRCGSDGVAESRGSTTKMPQPLPAPFTKDHQRMEGQEDTDTQGKAKSGAVVGLVRSRQQQEAIPMMVPSDAGTLARQAALPLVAVANGRSAWQQLSMHQNSQMLQYHAAVTAAATTVANRLQGSYMMGAQTGNRVVARHRRGYQLPLSSVAARGRAVSRTSQQKNKK